MTGAELRRWRERNHFTQAEAAKWAGVHVRTWIRWETGTSGIPKMLTLALAGY